MRIIIHTKNHGVYKSSPIHITDQEKTALRSLIIEGKMDNFSIRIDDSNSRSEVFFSKKVLDESVIILEES